MRLSLFYKGFAHLVDFLARAYGHFGFRHRAREIQLQGLQQLLLQRRRFRALGGRQPPHFGDEPVP